MMILLEIYNKIELIKLIRKNLSNELRKEKHQNVAAEPLKT